MSIALKVSTEALKSKAREVENEISNLENHINQVQDIIRKTTVYWSGLSGDKARREFLAQKENMDLVLKRFREHPSDLLKMAGLYEKGEQEMKEQNQKLKTDFIV